MRLSLLLALLALAAPAGAVLGTRQGRANAQRFGARSTLPTATAGQELFDGAAREYNRKPGRPGDSGRFEPERAANAFLSDAQSKLGVDPAQLVVLSRTNGKGHQHVLYQQTYKGLPVEFSRVKVHLDPSGNVLGAQSSYQTRLDVDVRPSVAASVAAYAVKRDAGQEPRSDGQLVIFPDPQTGVAHLAWKFTVLARGLWRYYVDAHSGELLFRYDDRHYACSCGGASPTCGTIRGQVYTLDPRNPPTLKPFAHERVYIGGPNTWVDTDVNGQFCSTATGKIFTQLQGPYVKVSNFRGPSASYDNSLGTWSTISTPVSSPHPYPNNADLMSPLVTVSDPNAVKVLPVFSSFNVGFFDSGTATGEGSGDIIDDDELQIIDSSGNTVASYVGARGAFNGAAVPGPSYRLRLRSNASGTQNGYDVLVSSYLVLNSPGTLGSAAPNAATADSGSFDWWPSSYNALGMRSEYSLFYHLNAMHDYFTNGPDSGGQAALTPIDAMAYVGPNLVNAFYDPDYDTLFFGDNISATPSDLFTDDATVSHHEYTHYVVEKIWPIQNFGQAGAISEANADYFSASSLNDPDIGQSAVGGLGGTGPLRELDCVGHPPCKILGNGTGGTTAWVGEIHDDSVFLSQALWEIRQNPSVGQTCADNAEFQALLYFPESFAELLTALNQVVSLGAAAGCGAPATVNGVINAAFAHHAIPNGTGSNDPYDTASRHNDGFETAVDISTLGPVSATIFPQADVDFYTFGAGPGWVTLTLNLPPNGFFYKGYMLTVFDRNHRQVAQAMPIFDGINTDSGYCTHTDCNTTQGAVVAKLFNASSNQYFVEVSGGLTVDGNSNSGVNSTVPYTLTASFSRLGAVGGSIVSAQVDGDVISFSVRVTSYPRTQDYNFAYAQLRDHAQNLVPNTVTHVPGQAGDYLLFVSSVNALGQISGQVKVATGFGQRFPAVGSVELEVFGYDVQGSTISLGLSNPINLTAADSDVKVYNNVMNPLKGDKATVRYDVQSAGHVSVRLYTLNGTFIETLFDNDVPAGKGAVDWDGHNFAGSVVASGIYLVHISGPGLSKTAKIAVVK